MEQDKAYLEIRRSTEPLKVWRRVLLTDGEISIGRLEESEAGVNLDLPQVSRKHAAVVVPKPGEGTSYTLKNVRGRTGIRLYEKLLLLGDQCALQSGYGFQIPGVLTDPADPYFSILFYLDNATTCLEIERCAPPHFRIFGQLVSFRPQEYALLEYLYSKKNQICPYADILATIWAPDPRTPELVQAYLAKLRSDPDEYSIRRESLNSILSRIRREISEASGGLALIETIRGEGLCLRTSCISGFCKDSPSQCQLPCDNATE
ncbi:winged helix-turn-helix domain-containing protein [Oscillochloris sp. ZM17-4]|uniref:winged helix-turn-helix domain-containing protein n=1 Tax=Oscillochloris sp. ZM17-4 TaxID=2866714 RepID=UPI001C72D40C|nr:winged helix-turn-helix domain-containing protein [Oscillochloris sp. ZM17-4]MBX0327653.1 winged helix-turn-helix domain-containing protein [Oscillochloris sp. ZM17-4]